MYVKSAFVETFVACSSLMEEMINLFFYYTAINLIDTRSFNRGNTRNNIANSDFPPWFFFEAKRNQ